MTSIKQRLKRQAANVPDKPGVYIFKDAQGDILYVGKGKSLRKRMSSYFRNNHRGMPRTAIMVKKIASFDIFVTANEVEALILESNLIKQHRPQYNVLLRDDKSYPWIAITLNDKFPRLLLTREQHIKGNRYFGPYTDVATARENLDTLRKIFPLRACRGSEPGKITGSPCLNFHIKRCLGPCTGIVNVDEYREMIKQVIAFLEGRTQQVVEQLNAQMLEASQELEFEKAARIRNSLTAATKITQRQSAIMEDALDLDVIGEADGEEIGCLQLFQIRRGRMVNTQTFVIKTGDDDQITAFIKQFYLQATLLPREIILPRAIDDQDLLKRWLKNEKGHGIKISVPQKGKKYRLVAMANDNARYSLDLEIKKQMDDEERINQALRELTDLLELKAVPARIECFDVSNISGTSAVSAMSVLESGRMRPSQYRKFRIRFAQGPNDFEMIRETIARRMMRLDDKKFGSRPDLVLVDGGKPQLTAALKAVTDAQVSDIEVAAIAKKEEEIFRPSKAASIRISRSSPALYMIQRLRNEAHRFAISYHRGLRGKHMLESELDGIPGIGPARRAKLIKHFGSLSDIEKAKLEELEEVLPKKASIALYDRLHRGRNGANI